MAGSTILKQALAIIVCIAMVTPRTDASIACGQVTEKLAPCLGFLESGRGPVPGCCKGVRDLNSMAVTTEDRRNACRCMKTAAAAFPSISSVYSAALPGKCGVSIPLAAGAKTDCSKIQ